MNINKNTNKNTNTNEKGNTMKKIILSAIVGTALSTNVMAENFQQTTVVTVENITVNIQEPSGYDCDTLIYRKKVSELGEIDKLSRSIDELTFSFAKKYCENSSSVVKSIVARIDIFNEGISSADELLQHLHAREVMSDFLQEQIREFTQIDNEWRAYQLENFNFFQNQGIELRLTYEQNYNYMNSVKIHYFDKFEKYSTTKI